MNTTLNPFIYFIFLTFFMLSGFMLTGTAFSQTVEYDLTIEKQTVTINDKTAKGMTINGAIPGPTLRFTNGDFARIRVHNKMDTDTSIHWHGLLVPPEMDGVPNISFPPIAPGETFVYEFPIRQDGTYWYHSHTHLQEQQGLYGSIVIKPKTYARAADQDRVLLLSDWTTQSPDTIIRTLKSGSEWYSLQKGSSQSILGAASKGELGSYFKRELQRMPAMDIADVAYDYFLTNGKPHFFIPADRHETLRLRIINGSATTYFYLEFAGGDMQIISADGQDVVPLKQKRFLIGVAETYDVLIKVPGPGRYELRATAHDGSGHSSTWIGTGLKIPAPDIPNPNLYASMDHGAMTSVFSLTPQGVMGMPDEQVDSGMFDKPGMIGMDHDNTMTHEKDMTHDTGMDQHSDMKMVPTTSMNEMERTLHGTHESDSDGMQMDQMPEPTPAMHDMTPMRHENEMEKSNHPMTDNQVPMAAMKKTPDMDSGQDMTMKSGKSFTYDYGFMASDVSSSIQLANDGMGRERPWPPYAQLRSEKPTILPVGKPIRELRFTLDGDMERYVWFLNKKPLSETDQILIKEGEIVRFIMINRTMMHHPMHLHGHFFRVINGQGDYSPLKHTVDVAPMSTTVIEFHANEVGDWFFHCHLLYHMKSGMARKFHYQDYEPSEPVKQISGNLFKDSWYLWGQADVLSHMTEGFFKFANTRNTVELDWEAGWQDVDGTQWEGTLTLDRYINRFFSVFAGGFMEGEDSDEEQTKGILGFHYLLPLNIDSRSWVDTQGEGRFSLEKEFELTPRVSLEAKAQYDTKEDWETSLGVSYMLHQNVSLTVKFHSEYQFGAGITLRF